MNHVTELSLSSDGRIPAEAWARAAERDRAEVQQLAPQPLLIAGVREISPAYIKRRMALVISRAAVSRGAVHLKDFERDGIDEATARRYLTDAVMMARMLEPKIDSAVEAA